jgi:hypothetical protein
MGGAWIEKGKGAVRKARAAKSEYHRFLGVS